MDKYNVYLISLDTLEADKRLATYFSLEQASKMEQVKCQDGFYIGSFLVKSDRDLELRNDIIKKNG